MAHGITLTMRGPQRTKFVKQLPSGASRDRSLSGKARIRARKAARKAG